YVVLPHRPRSSPSYFSRCAHPRPLHSFPTRRSSDLTRRPRRTRRRTRSPSPPAVAGRWHSSPHPPGGTRRAARTAPRRTPRGWRSEEHTSELQSRENLVCRLLLEKKKNNMKKKNTHT